MTLPEIFPTTIFSVKIMHDCMLHPWFVIEFDIDHHLKMELVVCTVNYIYFFPFFSDKKFRGQARPDLINIPSNKHESSNKRNSGVGGNGGERNAKTKQAVSASAGGGGGVGGERATNTSSAPALMKQQPLINKTADSSQNWRLDAKGKKYNET